MLKAIKLQIYPSKEQQSDINKLLGSCRFVFNNCLEHKIKTYNETKETIGFAKMGLYLTQLKKQEDLFFLNESHAKVLQQSLIDLETSYKNFFKNGMGFPKFKSKHNSRQSCRFPIDAIGKIKGNRINIIKKLKDIHFKCSVKDERYLNRNQDKIKSGTLSKTKSGKFFFSILIEKGHDKILPKSDKIVGIDLGIKSFIVTSDNKLYENLRIIRNNEEKLKRLHHLLSRKQKGSKNKNKARIKLARFHDKLNNRKENYLHKVVNELLEENQTIVIENLNVKGMMKNHSLARSIQELSINRFLGILRYKNEWYGRDVIEVDRYYPSSKLCNCCKNKNDDLKLSDREWKCDFCGSMNDRDLNAALNIRDEGVRILGIGKEKNKRY